MNMVKPVRWSQAIQVESRDYCLVVVMQNGKANGVGNPITLYLYLTLSSGQTVLPLPLGTKVTFITHLFLLWAIIILLTSRVF